MAFTLVGACTGNNSASTGTSNQNIFTLPAGAAAGDVYMAVLHEATNSDTLSSSPASAITRIGPNTSGSVLRCYAITGTLSATDISNGSLTFTWTGTGHKTIEACVVIRGADESQLVLGTAAVAAGVPVNTVTMPTVTTTVANSEVVALVIVRMGSGAAITPVFPTGYGIGTNTAADAIEKTANAGSVANYTGAIALLASPGAAGSYGGGTITITGASTVCAYTIAIAPGTSPVTPATRATSWTTLASVSATRATAWAVRSAVTPATRATSWNTLALPATPTGLTATGGRGEVDLAWTAVAGATSYNVYRGGVLQWNTLEASGVDTTGTVGTSYAYTVTAVNSGGESAQSSSASAASTALPAVATSAATFRTALASTATTPVRVMAIGDSIAEGQGATTVANRWLDKFVTNTRVTYQPGTVAGGVGFRPGKFTSTSLPAPATLAGSPSSDFTLGPGGRSLFLNGSGKSITFTVSGTSVDVMYATAPGAGTFSVSIDGGAATNINTNTGTGVVDAVVRRFTFGTRGSHTVALAWVSGTAYGYGVIVYDQDESAGIRTYDASHLGWSSTDYMSNLEKTTQHPITNLMTTVDPQLVIVNLATNDWLHGESLAALRTNLTNLMTLLGSTRSVVFLPAYKTDRSLETSTMVADWSQYVGVMYAVANAYSNVTIVDLSQLMPNVVGDVLGYYADQYHPNNTGHAEIATLLGSALISSTTPVTPATRATSWNTLSAVTSTRATAWTVKTTVTATRQTTWAALAQVTPTTRATTWTVLAPVGASTRATTWAVRAAVTAARATTWTTLATVAASRATTWNVAASVQASRATAWTVRAVVTGTRATTWAVLAAVTAAGRQTTWTTLATVQTTRATQWAVASALAPVTPATRATSWAVAAQVTSTRATSWTTLGQAAAATRATAWAVRSTVTPATRATTWAVLSVVTPAARATSWTVRGGVVPATRATTWATFATATGTRATTWTVRSSTVANRTTTWAVLEQVAPATRATSWAVLSSPLSTRSTTWTVRALIVTTRASSWAVLAGPDATTLPARIERVEGGSRVTRVTGRPAAVVAGGDRTALVPGRSSQLVAARPPTTEVTP